MEKNQLVINNGDEDISDKGRFKIVRNFFWFCAGVNRSVMEECPTEHSKYVAIGATVFFTALFASISGGYAINFVFAGSPNCLKIAVAVGVAWGLTIFNLDRYLVLSLKKRNEKRKEFLLALPRIVLAVMIGIVISRPLELKIFDKEIKESVKRYYQKRLEQGNLAANDIFTEKNLSTIERIDEKKTKRDSVKQEVARAIDLKDAECFGKMIDGKTTGEFGDGPNCKMRKEEVLLAQQKLLAVEKEITDLENVLLKAREETGLNKSVDIERYLDSMVENTGFFLRNKMLGEISGGSFFGIFFSRKNAEDVLNIDEPAVAANAGKDTANMRDSTITALNNKIARTQQKDLEYKKLKFMEMDGKRDPTALFISMLFIVIECLPIFVKLMSSRGSYDVRLDEEEKRLDFLSTQETYANKYLIAHLAEAQRELFEKEIDKWRDTQK